MRRVIVTGSSGLIGSETVEYFDARGWSVIGVDNNMRRDFFGPDGDTTWRLRSLQQICKRFEHHALDIRDRAEVTRLVERIRPHLIVHCAAQPSHDLAKDRPFDDFDINAGGTLNLLEATRRHCADAVFVFMSTNKVYGDAPNECAFLELPTRYDFAEPALRQGIDETCRVDACLHSLFGASKLAADIFVQEYGRYFGMPTVCFRGGCLTGGNHSGAELHGFLAYMARVFAENRSYRIHGYKGKQVRDNIHSQDVCAAIEAFHDNPRVAAVYNLGGGRDNSISILEALERFKDLFGHRITTTYEDTPRVGDHICYISNTSKFERDYPTWSRRWTIDETMRQLATAHRQRLAA